MMRRLILSALFALPAVSAHAQHSWGAEAQRAYQAAVDASESHRKNDTVELLQGLIGEAEWGSEASRSLISRLAALYYRQLKHAEAEALIAPFDALRRGEPFPVSIPGIVTVREGMSARVRKKDLAGALTFGEAAVSRYVEEHRTAMLADEVIESAFTGTEPGSAAWESIRARRVAVNARAVRASVELARLYSALAEVNHAMKQFPQAEQEYRLALALLDKNKASDPVTMMHTRTGLAILLRTRGDAAAALPLQQAALAEMKKTYSRNDPDRLESERELGQIQQVLRTNAGHPGPNSAPKRVKPGRRADMAN